MALNQNRLQRLSAAVTAFNTRLATVKQEAITEAVQEAAATIPGGGGGSSGVSSFNTRTGSVTLSSTDVTTALGFTPVTSYNDLTNKPTLFSGSYTDLTNKPSLFSGSYNDLTNKPTLFSGSYADLANKPTIPTVPSVLSAFTNDSGYLTADSSAANVKINSFGVGTAASNTSGEIRATNNITAYYSSDIKFKENIREIDSPLDKVVAIGGKYFDWTDEYINSHGGEDGYFIRKSDFGVIAQDVLKYFPIAVRTRKDGSLAVDYEKMCSLAFAAIKQLEERVKALEAK